MKRLAIIGLCVCARVSDPAVAQHTWCNPLDLDYKYDLDHISQRISYRSGADPVIVFQHGEYFLFVTNSGGWWRSSDLLNWSFVTPTIWPAGDMCAPAALSVRDTMYLFQSTFDPRPLYISTRPGSGELTYFNPALPSTPGALGPWDPDIFHDDATDRWYLYFGSSNVYPIYGIELDHSKKLGYIRTSTPLLSLHPDLHGWERFGQDHRDTTRPYIEGAWMTSHRGKYYLQYAAPGTEYNVYANGTYVGDHPLGPFTYAPYNPVSYKPGGFMAGAGHGNTFQDAFGNFWNTGTPWVAVNWNFERRVAMFPAGFDTDGQLFANTRFGDFPHFIPTRKWNDREELFTGWMLLSYRKPCTASSTLEGFPPSLVTDENPRTFWVAASTAPGEWVQIDLGGLADVHSVQVNYADYQSNVFRRDSTVYTQFRLYDSRDGRSWILTADLAREKRDRPNAYIEFPHVIRARYIRFEHVYVASAHLAVSDIRVFGTGKGAAPSVPAYFVVHRDRDQRDAIVNWDLVPGATGYNIRWGIRPDRLYETYQIFADKESRLEVRALNVGQRYFFGIEAFNEAGVSPLSGVIECR